MPLTLLTQLSVRIFVDKIAADLAPILSARKSRMYSLLDGMRVIEASSFIASPYAGMMLSQLGAEVIKIDPIGGGPDFRRWPLSEGGDSFYWEALNKGKKSIAVNLSDPEGRELTQALATGPSENSGIFLTNFPAAGFLSYEKLREMRPDLICARIMGWADGNQAVDYTVNPAVGLPYMTGPSDRPNDPVNHVLPAWDLLAGSTAALSILAAVQFRSNTGIGQEIRVPLSDLAAATMANLGQVAEVLIGGKDRAKMDNALFGAFGRDFVTADGTSIMVVGLTTKQWTSIITALGLEGEVAALEAALGVQFKHDAGTRFRHREQLEKLVEAAIAREPWDALGPAFKRAGVCYGPYRTLHQAVTQDDLFRQNPIFTEIDHPSGHSYPAPGFAASFAGLQRNVPKRAPRIGEHTEEILASVLKLPDSTIGDMIRRKIVVAA